ncbi:hypothetical protein HDV00_005664 [Rhizophlyctis rosea]|nr:hypothetical protein HDV00_005664 [Rhizophlyctis rosea]
MTAHHPTQRLTKRSLQNPFFTSVTQIVDSAGSVTKFAGVNWPGHLEPMIPEGLQYQSIDNIVERIAELGMNVVRLTWAVEMVDDILDGGGDISLAESLAKALGSSNGTAIMDSILLNNPDFNANTTRLEVFNAVAGKLDAREIFILFDNHVSKAMWCCNVGDGNGWFGEGYFDISKWKRGLEFMAAHIKQWSNVMGMSLRNEPRGHADWLSWYSNMTSAADIVHTANEDILIFFSGIDFDSTLRPIAVRADLGNGTKFNPAERPWGPKAVLELHSYGSTNCPGAWVNLLQAGFKSAVEGMMADAALKIPVVLTEFGAVQNDQFPKTSFGSCMATLIREWNISWIMWGLQGSYYIREGKQDYDESYGMVNVKRIQRNRAATRPEAEEVDYLKDEIADRIADRLLDIKRRFSKVVDLGSGAGHIAKFVTTKNIDELIMYDMSEKLLYRDASTQYEVPVTRIHGDEEHLPFAENSLDAIVSSLSLHWVNDLPGTLIQARRALKPDGLFLAGMFGGDTLYELRTSLQLAEIEREGGVAPHISPMTDVRDVGNLLSRAGFTLTTVDVDEVVVNYPSIYELMADLRSMGESNAIAARYDDKLYFHSYGANAVIAKNLNLAPTRKPYLKRDTLAAASAIYKEVYGDEDGSIPATFNIIYMIGWKPDPSQAKPAKRGSGDVSLKVLQDAAALGNLVNEEDGVVLKVDGGEGKDGKGGGGDGEALGKK